MELFLRDLFSRPSYIILIISRLFCPVFAFPQLFNLLANFETISIEQLFCYWCIWKQSKASIFDLLRIPRSPNPSRIKDKISNTIVIVINCLLLVWWWQIRAIPPLFALSHIPHTTARLLWRGECEHQPKWERAHSIACHLREVLVAWYFSDTGAHETRAPRYDDRPTAETRANAAAAGQTTEKRNESIKFKERNSRGVVVVGTLSSNIGLIIVVSSFESGLAVILSRK